MKIMIKYQFKGEDYYEDQTGTSRSMVDIQVGAQALDGEVVIEE